MSDTDTSCDHAGHWMDCTLCLRLEVARLREALQPFAAMHRSCDLRDQVFDEVACQRGVGRDLTMLTSRNFANAADVLKRTGR